MLHNIAVSTMVVKLKIVIYTITNNMQLANINTKSVLVGVNNNKVGISPSSNFEPKAPGPTYCWILLP